MAINAMCIRIKVLGTLGMQDRSAREAWVHGPDGHLNPESNPHSRRSIYAMTVDIVQARKGRQRPHSSVTINPKLTMGDHDPAELRHGGSHRA